MQWNGLTVVHDITRACLTFALSALLWSSAGQAQSNSQEYDFDIPRVSVVEALGEFSKQTDFQYGYLPQSPEEEHTLVGPITGRFTVEAVLTKILEPIDSSFEWLNERTVTIVPPPIVTQPTLPLSPEITLEHDSSERLRNKLQGILVVASRLWIDDSLEPPTALSELDRPTIEALGVSTLPELLRYLTQQPFARSDLSLLGDQRVELRGLGRDTTLVLINGRRAGESSASFDLNAFDLNIIPLAAVERIEVIQDFLPFAVGADAIGGMINVVLRTDFTEPLLEVNYGAAEGGAGERRATVGLGGRLGTVRVSGLLDHFDRGALLGAARERWRDQDYRRFDSVDYRSLSSNPGNVQSLMPGNLPGLPSRFAAVPRHESSRPLSPEDFLVTAGSRNLDSLRRYRSIVPERERSSVVLSAQADVSPTTLLFAEFFYTRGTTVVRDSPAALSNVVVPATNPFNPFGTAVGVSFLASGADPRTWTTEGEFQREVAGLQGEWRGWPWEFWLQRMRDTTRVTQANELDPLKVADALAQSDPDRALNVLDDGPGGSPALIKSLMAAPLVREYVSENTQATARARGELLDMPAGAVSLSWGGEWRTSSMSIDTRLPRSPERTVASGFLEIRVPVIDERMALAGIHGLALAAAGRLDDYSDIGRVTSRQIGLTWEPVKSISVRAAYGTNYRPPSIFEAHMPVVQLPSVVTDFRRNNQITNVTGTFGGNPDLDPTTARSWSTGFSFDPQFASGLNLAASYWQARLRKRLTPIPLPVLFAHEDLFPGRVVRAPPTAADLAAGQPGALLALDTRLSDIGTLAASGIDLSVSLEADTRVGRFKPTLSATWVDEFRVFDLPGLPVVDLAGVASIFGSMPRWHANAGITWEGDGLAVATTARWVSAYDDFDFLRNRDNGRTVDARTYLDIHVSLTLDRRVSAESPLRGLRLTAGVTNLLNTHPAFAEIGIDSGYDFTQGDLKGRFSYIRLAKQF